MVPPSSLRVPRARRYSGYSRPLRRFAYETLTLFGRASHPLRLQLRVPSAVHTPPVFLPMVWPLPVSLATTPGISFDFSSSAYLDVSVRQVPLIDLCVQSLIRTSSVRGFPHSDIHGSMLTSNSPWLFAGNHVLLRLSVPRHPPYALLRLNSSLRFSYLRSLACLSFANNCWVALVSQKDRPYAPF